MYTPIKHHHHDYYQEKSPKDDPNPSPTNPLKASIQDTPGWSRARSVAEGTEEGDDRGGEHDDGERRGEGAGRGGGAGGRSIGGGHSVGEESRSEQAGREGFGSEGRHCNLLESSRREDESNKRRWYETERVYL